MILKGNLGEDAEVKQVGSKTAINFKVGVTMDHRDKDGKKVERTEWVKAVMWRDERQSTKISEYLKKGKGVLLEGTPASEAYQGKDGAVKSYLSISVKELEFLN